MCADHTSHSLQFTSIAARLQQLGIELPNANAAAANYVTHKTIGSMVYIAGQTCKRDGQLIYSGRIGRDLSIEEGIAAARLCGLNVLAQLQQACDGDLDRVKNAVRLTIFINSNENFYQQAQIANGVSDLLVDVFGERGRHTRSSISAYSIPGNSAVEVDAIFEIE
jgi:enamine deaminase RidA (YjgF/YER057c/UK114 family)